MPVTVSRRLAVAVLVLIAGLFGVIGWLLFGRGAPAGGPAGADRAAERQATKYHCPMHPTMISDRPGDCPICGMRMVPMEPAGKDSMGMEMVPVEVEAQAGAAADVEGLATVQIPLGKQQLIGVRTTVVRKAPFIRAIRTVGRVVADETRLHHLHTKIGGWIEKLYVDTTGQQVRAGEPLLDLYSPELLATQEEYLLALRARAGIAGGALPDAARRADELVESARRRLLLFDLTPAQIEALERSGRAERTVTLHAPISGHVLVRNVTHGQKIDPDTPLLDIADLTRVWVLASVYEYELPFVKNGQQAVMTLSYLPGRSYRGRVTLVYPVLEEATRTVQVRLEFDNSRLELKPGMYADVRIDSDLGERLSVPESALLSSGTRNVVFVARGGGIFEPREVRVGVRLPDAVEILEGLRDGEVVVTSGTFFIDSESKLKAALKSATPAPPGDHVH
ncbi:MAG: efflux RND transporter periplasmic adaptor subunit [Candidatus Polarisedimenticolia bacterium]